MADRQNRDPATVAAVEKTVRHAQTQLDLIGAEAGRAARTYVDALAEIEAALAKFDAAHAKPGTNLDALAELQAVIDKTNRSRIEAQERFAKVSAVIAAAPAAGRQ